MEGKAIIWAHWRHDIDTIVESIEDKYPGSVVTYYGDTSTEDRQKAIRKIQDPESKVRFWLAPHRPVVMELPLQVRPP